MEEDKEEKKEEQQVDDKIENNVQEEKVEEQAKKSKKGHKEIKGKSLTVFIIVIIVLAMALSFGSGMILGHKLGDNKKDNNEKPKENEVVDNKDETENENQEKDNNEESTFKTVSKYEANAIMKQFTGIIIPSERLFAKDKFNIDDINIDEMLVTALRQINIYNACSREGIKDVSLFFINDKLSNYVKKDLSLNDLKSVVKNENFDFGYNPYDFTYSIQVKDEKSISIIDNVCDGIFSASDFVIREMVDAKRENEYVYIYFKEAFGRYSNSSEELKVDYYTDYNKSGKIMETLSSPEFTDGYGNRLENSEPNWDLYNTYKYTFKLIDEEYYFQSLELVK